MIKINLDSPKQEQQICIHCGLCCDGTLFSSVKVEKGEKGLLPRKMEDNYFSIEKEEFFKQPCLCFDTKCTIYNQRPDKCSAFRCQLLKKLSKGEIDKINAEKVIYNAIELRNEVFQLYKTISKSNLTPSFRELLFELRKKNETNIAENIKDKKLELLIFKSNIFEILLIKHFKSSKEFESLIME